MSPESASLLANDSEEVVAHELQGICRIDVRGKTLRKAR